MKTKKFRLRLHEISAGRLHLDWMHTIERNMMESVKQQAFTLRNTGVDSFLERGVNYWFTGIMKNLVLHGKERFSDKPQ